MRFSEDLTLLAGENNGGKTTVIDALRLVTAPSDGRRSRYPTTDDVRHGTSGPLELQAEFADLSDGQKGLFYVALTSHGSCEANFGYSWAPPPPTHRGSRPMLTVGPRRAPDPEPELRTLIRHVHLPALRDAARDLASSSPGRIEFLVRHLLGTDTAREDELLVAAKSAFSGLLGKGVLKDAADKVAKSFLPFTDGFHSQEAHLGFAGPSLAGLARDLRFQLAHRGLDPAELVQTGLGYANLLYIASVLVELDAARDAELTLLLVEEPEAHLHPQLQAVTLDFLKKKARDSRSRKVGEGEHAGRVQVVASTHSPSLAASVPSSHVVVLRAVPGPPAADSAATTPPSDSARPSVPCSTAIAICELSIPGRQRRKVDRYLDVTRSGVLFARRVILIEGMAEALLVPVFAREVFSEGSDAWRRFLAASVVAIDGVDFEPYVRLLLTPPERHNYTVAERVAVITDEDPYEGDTPGQDVATRAEARSSGRERDETLKGIVGHLGTSARLRTFITPQTFECALVAHCEQEDQLAVLETAFATLVAAQYQDKRRELWRARVGAASSTERPLAFTALLASTRTRKGDFAQSLAAVLQDDHGIETFGVPAAFREALLWVVDDK